MITRRGFIGGVIAATGGIVAPRAFAADGGRLLRFGVLTDVHILWSHPEHDEFLEKELRFFDAQGVDAVAFTGDLTHTCIISELERFATVWNKVFPGGCGGDGRKVERLIVTGNHDAGAWKSRWTGWSDARMRKERVDWNFKELWPRLFGEEWSLVWKREVKGVSFVGAQWQELKPPVGAFLAEHARELSGPKPFFYLQHGNPLGTCNAEESKAGAADDGGLATAALSAFPLAVALSGHSHISLADRRCVWQGAFTSISCGCAGKITPAGLNNAHHNGGAIYDPARMNGVMRPMTNEVEASCGLVIDVFVDRLLLRRQSFFFDEPLGGDWIVPLPAMAGGPFDFNRAASETPPPQFATDAKVKVAYCERAPESAGMPYAGKEPCVRVTFPCAEGTGASRVYDYEVRAQIGDKVWKRIVYSPGYHVPEGRSLREGECLYSLKELPEWRRATYSVVPRNCYETKGRAIKTEVDDVAQA